MVIQSRLLGIGIVEMIVIDSIVRRSAALGALILLASGSCDSLTRRARYPDVQRLATLVQERATRQSCGDEATGLPRALMTVTETECLSCLLVGYLGREFVRQSRGSAQVWLVVPATDTSVICAFLRQERVRAPVLSVTRAQFDWPSPSAGMLFAELDSRFIVHATVGLQDAEGVLDFVKKGTRVGRE